MPTKLQHSGVLDQLATLCAVDVDAGRTPLARQALECLAGLLASPALRTSTFLQEPVKKALQHALQSPDVRCRVTALTALDAVAETYAGASALLNAGFMQALVGRVHVELTLAGSAGDGTEGAGSPLLQLLRCLRSLLSRTETAAVEAALAAGAVSALAATLVAHPVPSSVTEVAAGALQYLCVPTAGKGACLALQSLLNGLVALVAAGAGTVGGAGAAAAEEATAGSSRAAALDCAAAAAGCLMHLATDEAGGKAALTAAGAVGAACDLLMAASTPSPLSGMSPAAVASLYACQGLASLCALPAAQAQVVGRGEVLTRLGLLVGPPATTALGADTAPGAASASSALGKAAALCLAAAQWRP